MAMPLPSLTGGAGGAAGPSQARDSSGGFNSMFDGSGWTVSTGRSQSKGGTSGSSASIPWVMLLAVGIGALILWKRL